MNLPATGTAALLERLSPFVPDDHINALVPRHGGRGRRTEWSASQLLRVSLLLLLLRRDPQPIAPLADLTPQQLTFDQI